MKKAIPTFETLIERLSTIEGFLKYSDQKELKKWWGDLGEEGQEYLIDKIKVIESFLTDGNL